MDATFIYFVSWSKIGPAGAIHVSAKRFTDFQSALNWFTLHDLNPKVSSCSLFLHVYIGDIHVAQQLF